LIHAEVLQPLLKLVCGSACLGCDRVGLGAHAPDDEQDDQDRDRDHEEEHDERADRARDAVTVQPGHCRAPDGCDHEPHEHRDDDRRRDAEDPREPDEERRDSDEQPGGDSEIPKPARSGEHGGQLPQLIRIELDDGVLHLAVLVRRGGEHGGGDLVVLRTMLPEPAKPHDAAFMRGP